MGQNGIGGTESQIPPRPVGSQTIHKERGLLSAIVILIVVILTAVLFFSWTSRRDESKWTKKDAVKKQAILDSISERKTIKLSPSELKIKEELVKSIAR